jgi:hypothetical protein
MKKTIRLFIQKEIISKNTDLPEDINDQDQGLVQDEQV